MLTIQKNILLTGSEGKPMATDIFYHQDGQPKPVIIYAHGFNGFKDWANFDLIAIQFAEAGYVFVKFNFSHNGTTPASPEDFTDLEAYGNNNYSKELFDLGCVIDWVVSSPNPYSAETNKDSVGLIGHSKGGSTILIKASEDTRIKAATTWAAVKTCQTPWGSWDEEKMADWKQTGVAYTTNSRTKQEMPLYYQLYEDYLQNEERLNIEKALAGYKIPLLIIHGTEDTSVTPVNAGLLRKWYPASELQLVPSDHVFGRKHPWTEPALPPVMQQVVDRTLAFFKKVLN